MKIDSNSLLLLHDAVSLSDGEFLLLYDMNKSNLTMPNWNYPKFELDSFENDKCVSEFRFEKKDVYVLGETLEIPGSIIVYNGTKVDGIESLCIFLNLVSAIFYEIFIFSPNDIPSKTLKNVFYFIEKALFVLEIFKFF